MQIYKLISAIEVSIPYEFSCPEFFIESLLPILISVVLSIAITMRYDTKRIKQAETKELEKLNNNNISNLVNDLERATSRYLNAYLSFKGGIFDYIFTHHNKEDIRILNPNNRRIVEILMTEATTYNTSMKVVFAKLKFIDFPKHKLEQLQLEYITQYTAVKDIATIYSNYLQKVLTVDHTNGFDIFESEITEAMKKVDFNKLISFIVNINYDNFYDDSNLVNTQ